MVMTQAQGKILLTGATGTVGREVVKQVRAAKAPIRILARDSKKARAGAPDAEIVEGDLERSATVEAALKGVERAFLLVPAGPKEPEIEASFIRAARKAGVKHVVLLSSIGADAKSSLTLARWHGLGEEELKRSGLKYTILEPHYFMQNMLMNAGSIHAQGAFYAPMEEARISMIDARDIAAVAAKALTSYGHEGKTYALTGPEALSFTQAAEILSKGLGRSVKYVNVSPADARGGMVKAGLPDWLADALGELYAVFRAGHGAAVSDAVEKVLGRKPRTFADFVRDNAGAFAPAAVAHV